MKIFYISENQNDGTNAGNKARNDTEKILFSKKYFPVKGVKSTNRLKHGNKLYFTINNINFLFRLKEIPTDSYVIVQYPFLMQYNNGKGWLDCSFVLRNLFKKNKVILLIHDIDELRFPKARGSINDLNQAAYIISHNKKMTDYLIKKGIDKNKIVNLGVFDYLIKKQNIYNHYNDKALLCYAGNLTKSQFIYNLPESVKELGINLYGNGYIKNDPKLNYKGAFPSEKISSIIKGKYGLIWDGQISQTCNDYSGNYLKYNNPHKLSMYLAANMPIIIWDQAAESDFVKNNGLGITIKSLYEIPKRISKVSEQDYDQMNQAVQELRQKIEKGYFLKAALDKIESKIDEK